MWWCLRNCRLTSLPYQWAVQTFLHDLLIGLGRYSPQPIWYVSQYHRHDTIYIVILLAMVKRLSKGFKPSNLNIITNFVHSSDPLFSYIQGPKLQSLVSHNINHAFPLFFFLPYYYLTFGCKHNIFLSFSFLKKMEVSIFEWVYRSIDRQKNIAMHRYTDVSSQPFLLKSKSATVHKLQLFKHTRLWHDNRHNKESLKL
jgi:hypothetical protein